MRKSSNKLLSEIAPIYNNVITLNKKTVSGYKVVIKKGENHYSVITGLFRYQLGQIRETHSYKELYEDTVFFNNEIKNHIIIFSNKEDAINLIKDYEEADMVLLEIKMGGNLKTCECTNKNINNAKVYLGKKILSKTEIDLDI